MAGGKTCLSDTPAATMLSPSFSRTSNEATRPASVPHESPAMIGLRGMPGSKKNPYRTVGRCDRDVKGGMQRGTCSHQDGGACVFVCVRTASSTRHARWTIESGPSPVDLIHARPLSRCASAVPQDKMTSQAKERPNSSAPLHREELVVVLVKPERERRATLKLPRDPPPWIMSLSVCSDSSKKRKPLPRKAPADGSIATKNPSPHDGATRQHFPSSSLRQRLVEACKKGSGGPASRSSCANTKEFFNPLSMSGTTTGIHTRPGGNEKSRPGHGRCLPAFDACLPN